MQRIRPKGDRLPVGPGAISPGCLKEKAKHDLLPKVAQTICSSLGKVKSVSFLDSRIGSATSGKLPCKCCGDCGFVIVYQNGTKVLAVFDGVGGKPDDACASRTCAEAAKDFLVENPGASMRDAIIHAEQALMATERWRAYPDENKPGCTACLVRISKKGKVDGAFAGDCFAIVASRDFKTHMLSRYQRSDDGVGLSCYLGKNASSSQDIKQGILLAPGDAIVVSSDGLENVLEKEIGICVQSHTNMENAALELLRISNSRSEFREYDALGTTVHGKADDRLVIAYSYE